MHNYTIKDRMNLFLHEVVKNVGVNNFEDADKFLKDPKERYFKVSQDSGLSAALNPNNTRTDIDYIRALVGANIDFAYDCKKGGIPVIRDENGKISQKTIEAIEDSLRIESFLDKLRLGFYINYLNQLE